MMRQTLELFMEDDMGIYLSKKEITKLHEFINRHVVEVIGIDREIDYTQFDVNQGAEAINMEKAKQRERAGL